MSHSEVVQYEFAGFVARIHSPAMQHLMRQLQTLALRDANVLIQGETGTGKELAARALHQFSERRNGPWVDLSCATLPDHLVESELFGYEKGAFSGALTSKPGMFELAQGGTLFLDEIGEMDLRLQGKLLRVLDGAGFYRLGGTRKISVDVRVTAATNRELLAAAERGEFRADLYYRLSELTIRVPPLRERVEDVRPLAEWFLASSGCTLRPNAVAALERHAWPGNVRELRNAVTAAAAASAGAWIGIEHLPEAVRMDSGLAALADLTSNGEPVTRLDDLERRAIARAMVQSGGHQQNAARLLGISRRTLSRKLKGLAPAEASAGG